jgi:hypothetical protein
VALLEFSHKVLIKNGNTVAKKAQKGRFSCFPGTFLTISGSGECIS